jgi:pilus assembly protein CpaF
MPGAAHDGVRSANRSLGQIFAATSDTKRDALMRQTWNAFNSEMAEAVGRAIDKDRSPAEIAYAVGEVVHNYFRARGATLTSYELRGLVSELLGRHSVGVPEMLKAPVARDAGLGDVVSFDRQPLEAPWQAEEPVVRRPVVAEKAFEPPASPVVDILKREEASFDRLLSAVVVDARPGVDRRDGRGDAKAAVAAALDRIVNDEGGTLSEEMRRQIEVAALSELRGLGLIDRLWRDHTIRTVFVNGPSAIYVERLGIIERAKETFRDQAHLGEILERLVRRPVNGVAEFRLRDGAGGVVVFPPAAPRGPVLVLRRAEPGEATFERLIAAGMMTRAMADLMRIAAHCRLNVLVVGPASSGKTALLAALAHDLGEARLVTIARHRAFRSALPARIELVAEGGETSLRALLAAASSLRPDLLILDSVQIGDMPALVERLSYGRGTAAAIETSMLAMGPPNAVDLVVRLARGGDGLCRVVSMQDAVGTVAFAHEAGQFLRRSANLQFAEAVQAAGRGDALAAVLR